MRRSFFVVWLGLAVSCLARSPRSTDAATIEGRVVNSAGEPLAGAEVRIWQKLEGLDGRFVDRSVEFDGSDMLLTDAEGRFVSPDVLNVEAYTQIVAEARGMLAGRSGWNKIAKDEVAAKTPDITLKRLRIVIGKVLDRRGQPVDGATVFNSGDGHERVEATSKGGGKFLLSHVPEGGVFLFAEKPGYRFTGVRLPADQAKATLLLTSLDESAEPKATLPPLLSPDEEYALARAVLDPWLERLAKSGTPQQRIRGFSSLIQINGLEAFQRLDSMGNVDKPTRDRLRHSAIHSVITHHDRTSWDELRAMIEAGDDEYHKTAELIQATDEMDDGEVDEDKQAMRLEWIDSAVPHARKIADPTRRVAVLASLSERLFDVGEVARARQILAEAENDMKPLFPDNGAQYAALHLALAAAHDDADRAMDWLAKAGIYLRMHGGRVAAGLLPDHPRRAVEAWKRVAEAMHNDRGRTGFEARAAAEFCYRLAKVDRPLAEQAAADAQEAVEERIRATGAIIFRAKGAIILALAEKQPAEARRFLAALVREELPQRPIEESTLLVSDSAPATAAWLLPAAERVDPDLCSELFWRSLALRLPRPSRNTLDDQAEFADIELAKLLARYDRDIALVLLEPLAANASALGPVQVRSGVADSILQAAAHVDPRWAKSILDTLADPPVAIQHAIGQLDDMLRFHLLNILALPLPDRWNAQYDSAGFWEPSARDKPLPP
ncbi:MAG TPA: carboxypeptidase-like regulatory domain-containing protein [Pirellulales bacterium]|nr:carboxypeptidase-like regulatory domain-containing protein [Pirellulales bacterium]